MVGWGWWGGCGGAAGAGERVLIEMNHDPKYPPPPSLR